MSTPPWRVTCTGVTVLAGPDATPAGSIAAEVMALAAAGLSPTESLATASSAARRYFGRPGLAIGQAADIVTFEDDPRDDPGVLARPAAIVRQGRRVA